MSARIRVTAALAAACFATLHAQAPAPVKAFTGLRLIDGTDRGPVANATIVVKDGKISAAGPASSVSIPDGAERISLSGRTVIPGLVNAHGHVGDTLGLEGNHYSADNVMRDLKLSAA